MIMTLSRNEKILSNILGADYEILPPMSRIEVLLIEIMNMLAEYGLTANSDGNGNVELSVERGEENA